MPKGYPGSGKAARRRGAELPAVDSQRYRLGEELGARFADPARAPTLFVNVRSEELV